MTETFATGPCSDVENAMLIINTELETNFVEAVHFFLVGLIITGVTFKSFFIKDLPSHEQHDVAISTAEKKLTRTAKTSVCKPSTDDATIRKGARQRTQTQVHPTEALSSKPSSKKLQKETVKVEFPCTILYI